MSTIRFNECLKHIHWSTETLAAILGCHESLTEAYSLGLTEVPPKLGAWLEVLAVAHEVAESGRPTGLKGRRHTGLMQ